MKSKWALILILLSPVFYVSCKKGDPNGGSSVLTLTTTEASKVTATSAVSGGTITADGGSPITVRGICWNNVNTSLPTISDSATVDGTGKGTFVSTMRNLQPYQTYYIRAYAINSSSTAYGNVVTVVTTPGVTIQSQDVQLLNHDFLCQTEIKIYGMSDPSSKPITQSGICWSTSKNPTINNSSVKQGPLTKASTLFTTPLPLGISGTYYIRGFATSSTGTIYGNEIQYTATAQVGLRYGGGIIFYVDNTGIHGLIAAETDQAASVPWAPPSLVNIVTHATGNDGAANTTAIINTYKNTGTYAAKVCRDYRGSGFTDWYLPSSYELNILDLYSDKVGNFPGPVHYTDFYYWSSTEYDYFRAWELNFNPLYYEDFNEIKDKFRSVRAIRKF